eukprot:11077-Heterococcus_DN1.PRE.1
MAGTGVTANSVTADSGVLNDSTQHNRSDAAAVQQGRAPSNSDESIDNGASKSILLNTSAVSSDNVIGTNNNNAINNSNPPTPVLDLKTTKLKSSTRLSDASSSGDCTSATKAINASMRKLSSIPLYEHIN